MSLLDVLECATGKPYRRGSEVDRLRSRSGVGRSAEWVRISTIPRRRLDLAQVPDLSPIWRIDDHQCPGCDLCRGPDGASVEPHLRPVQSAIQLEAEAADGLLAAVGVGHGKELSCLLLPDALAARRAVVLTMPRLRDQMLNRDVPRYGRHFRLPVDRIDVVSYSRLSSADRGGVLDADYDIVIANECHALRNYRSSARARYFWDWARERLETTRFCFLSGTIANNSVRDYAHLLWLALRGNSPLPEGYRELEDWSRALDVPEEREDRYPIAPGALLDLCGEETRGEEFAAMPREDQINLLSSVVLEDGREAERTLARRVYRRRLIETPGVVASGNAGDADCSLVLSARMPEMPPEVQRALDDLRRTWSIGGDEIREASELAAKARQLAAGFYYRWEWGAAGPDCEWLAARAAWHKEIREAIKHRCGLYSPLMVWREAERAPDAYPAFRPWLDVRDRWRPHPPRVTEWLSDFLVEDCLTWCAEGGGRGIVWYEHAELGERLAARGLSVFGGGSEGDRIMSFDGPACAASIAAHSDGKNLQHFCRNLITTPPANGKRWQQLLGRTHRSGQRAHEVGADVYAHDQSLRSALASAVADARFIEEAHGERQKLLYAVRVGMDFLDE